MLTKSALTVIFLLAQCIAVYATTSWTLEIGTGTKQDAGTQRTSEVDLYIKETNVAATPDPAGRSFPIAAAGSILSITFTSQKTHNWKLHTVELRLTVRQGDSWYVENITLYNNDRNTRFKPVKCRCWVNTTRTERMESEDCGLAVQGFPNCTTGCSTRTYGYGCGGTCHCAQGRSCNTSTGACPNGECEVRYGGTDCQLNCPGLRGSTGGDWGPRCQYKCHCKNPVPCDVTTGYCPSGECNRDYFGLDCQGDCSLKYGSNCQSECHCGDGLVSCDRNTGQCPGKCQQQYWGFACQKYCARGFFGDGCRGECHCAVITKCNVSNGDCGGVGCLPGYKGSDCQSQCVSPKFGQDCKEECHCDEKRQPCNHRNGICPTGVCEHRYYRRNCAKKCPDGFYSIDESATTCTGVCHCFLDASCAAQLGVCTQDRCKIGYDRGTKNDCQTKCAHGTYGVDCGGKCNCLDDTACNHITGTCPAGCAARSAGPFCQKSCFTEGTFAADASVFNITGQFATCTETCRCKNYTFCRATDGLCLRGGCEAQYKGKSCQERCKTKNWGINCDKPCNCDMAAPCDSVSGECPGGLCDYRWYGTPCQQQCPEDTFIDSNNQCTQTCQCINNTRCRAATGYCQDGCIDGYEGPACQQACKTGKYGRLCASQCFCKDNSQCNHIDGNCGTGGCDVRHIGYHCNITCELHRYFKQGKCDGVCRCDIPEACNIQTGACVSGRCEAGFMGKPFCNKQCSGTFGQDCSKTCHCKDDDICDPVTGKCPNGCLPRWTAEDCQFTCKVGRWGLNCSGHCRCLNINACTVASGSCYDGQCLTIRQYGDDCQKSCRHNRYLVEGECSGICHCVNSDMCVVNNGVCLDGKCLTGWRGSSCHLPCTNGTFGLTCAFECHCRFGVQCDHITGRCPGGCAVGYFGKFCQDDHIETGVNVTSYVFVGVVGVLLALAAAVSLIIRRLRTKEKQEAEAAVREVIDVLSQQSLASEESARAAGIKRSTSMEYIQRMGSLKRRHRAGTGSQHDTTIDGGHSTSSILPQRPNSAQFGNTAKSRWGAAIRKTMGRSADSALCINRPPKLLNVVKQASAMRNRSGQRISMVSAPLTKRSDVSIRDMVHAAVGTPPKKPPQEPQERKKFEKRRSFKGSVWKTVAKEDKIRGDAFKEVVTSSIAAQHGESGTATDSEQSKSPSPLGMMLHNLRQKNSPVIPEVSVFGPGGGHHHHVHGSPQVTPPDTRHGSAQATPPDTSHYDSSSPKLLQVMTTTTTTTTKTSKRRKGKRDGHRRSLNSKSSRHSAPPEVDRSRSSDNSTLFSSTLSRL